MEWRVFSNIRPQQLIEKIQQSGDAVKALPFSWIDENFSYLKDRIYMGSGSPVDKIFPPQDIAFYLDVDQGTLLWIWHNNSWHQIKLEGESLEEAQYVEYARNADLASNTDTVDGYHASEDPSADTAALRDANGDLKATVFISTSSSDPPIQVSSSTLVNNLNADLLDGFHAAVEALASTLAVHDSNNDLHTRQFIALTASLAPLLVSSTTLVSNLNADMLDGYHASLTSQAFVIPVLDDNGRITNFLQINFDPAVFAGAIDLTYATQDYPLAVGQVAKVNFSNTTSKPLRIATQSGTAYLLWINPSNTGGTSGGTGSEVYLNPNNTTYTDAFVYADVSRSEAALGAGYFTYSAFRIGFRFTHSFCVILNYTQIKSIIGICNVYGGGNTWPFLIVFATNWRDTTTPWTSLGTVAWPQNSSGVIYIQRIM